MGEGRLRVVERCGGVGSLDWLGRFRVVGVRVGGLVERGGTGWRPTRPMRQPHAQNGHHIAIVQPSYGHRSIKQPVAARCPHLAAAVRRGRGGGDAGAASDRWRAHSRRRRRGGAGPGAARRGGQEAVGFGNQALHQGAVERQHAGADLAGCVWGGGCQGFSVRFVSRDGCHWTANPSTERRQAAARGRRPGRGVQGSGFQRACRVGRFRP